jgi:hypothetical protein
LDLIPYIQLPVTFDYQSCLKEAFNLLNLFVVHREQDQKSKTGGKWKSLALRAVDGDFGKTHHFFYYKKTGPVIYKETSIVKFCPNIMNFISTLVDIERCERIRLMLLEPGAKIEVHSDSQDRPVYEAINVALNMPVGCVFKLDLNPDGTSTFYTKMVPFSDGSAFLLNVAKFHCVENNSTIPRVHIIIHGPLKLSRGKLLELAKHQNRLSLTKEVLTKLFEKYALLGLDLEFQSRLFQDWKLRGIDKDSLPISFKLIVVDDTQILDLGLRKKCLENITGASLFPLKYSVINDSSLDFYLFRTPLNPELNSENMTSSIDSSTEFVVLIGSGTFIVDTGDLVIEILKLVSRMRKLGAIISGHIINRKSSRPDGPCLHEQFAIIDIKNSKKMNIRNITIRDPYELRTFPGYLASEECVHDDYTPLWIKPSYGTTTRVRMGWGSDIIAKSLKHDSPVLNISAGIRRNKLYAYPKNYPHPMMDKILNSIRDKTSVFNNSVYFFNNEDLKIPQFFGFKPNKLLSVAAGLKPARIANQYWSSREIRECVFLDASENALSYLERLTQQTTENEIVRYVSKRDD